MTIPKKHIYVNFLLKEISLVSCNEGELISRVISYLNKKSRLQQEKEKLEQEKEKLQQEKEKLEQEKEKLQQEKEKFEQEKEKLQQKEEKLEEELEQARSGANTQLLIGLNQWINKITVNIGETAANIRETTVSIREITANIMKITAIIMEITANIRALNTRLEELSVDTTEDLGSSRDLVIYSGSGSEVDSRATVDRNLIESCSTWEKPLQVVQRCELLTERDPGGVWVEERGVGDNVGKGS